MALEKYQEARNSFAKVCFVFVTMPYLVAFHTGGDMESVNYVQDHNMLLFSSAGCTLSSS